MPQFNAFLHFMSNFYGPSQIISAVNLPKIFIATVLKPSDLHNHMIQDPLVSVQETILSLWNWAPSPQTFQFCLGLWSDLGNVLTVTHLSFIFTDHILAQIGKLSSMGFFKALSWVHSSWIYIHYFPLQINATTKVILFADNTSI
jgi:hypothetical protein